MPRINSHCNQNRPVFRGAAQHWCVLLGLSLFAAPLAGVLGQVEEPADPDSPAVRQPASNLPADAIPTTYPVDRYLEVWSKSPFQREVAPIAKAAVKSFARDYAVYGLFEMGDDPIVTLINRKTRNTTRVSKRPRDGFQLVKLQKGKNRKDLIATISKDGETADLTFDDALLNTPAVMIAQAKSQKNQTNPNGRSLLGTPRNAIARPNAPGVAANPRATGGTTTINPPTKPTAPVTPTNPPAAPNTGDIKSDLGPNTATRRRVVLPTPRPSP